MHFLVCGDALFSSRNLRNRLEPNLVELFDKADVAFANAEFCTPKRTSYPAAGRGFITSVTPDTLEEFASLHIRYVNFAHNHTGDFGVQGMLDTMEAAKEHGLVALGIGRTLDEARKAHFYDGKDGRIAIVAATSTRSEVFAASNPGNGVEGRPGCSPLRWKRSYVLPEKEFNELKAIDELIGTADSCREGARIETFKPLPPDTFLFGSLFEGNLTIEKGDEPHVRTYASPSDEKALLERIHDASKRADFVLATLHTHEGRNENWYSDEPPEFIKEYAHKAIDAGASAFVGHGAHFMRGIEIYHGRPIFYNIGSLLMEFEAGESIICPEMYEAYGYGPDTLPSTLHGNRIKDKAGHFIGVGSEHRFSQNAIVDFEIVGHDHFSYSLIPLNLGLTRENPLHRGIPYIADGEERELIRDRLVRISKPYGTKLFVDSGRIRVKE
jgi:poly-gamma-glutamate capsule biosynthesis protein CapA/YwtB (metallophosphatase superfamily)